MLIITNLIGFMARRRPAATSPTTLTFVAGEFSSNSDTVNAPSGLQAGDLLIMMDWARDSGALPTTAIPTGFTAVTGGNFTSTASGNNRMIASYGISDGTETSFTGMAPGDSNTEKVILAFRPDQPINAVVTSTPLTQGTTGNPTAQVVTASGGTPPLVVLGMYASSGTIDVRTMTPTKTGEVGTATESGYIAYANYNSSPVDTTVDMNDEGAMNMMESFYLSVS